MDKKSKILIIAFLVLILISIGVTYWRIMVKRNYVISSQIDCDPAAEKCFIWKCDPQSDVEGEACTGDPEADIWYYKIAKRNAAKIPQCDPETDETCDPWTCAEGERDCEQILCDEVTVEEQGVECNDPEEYNLNNPPKEENLSAKEAVCEEGDENCVVPEGDTEECTATVGSCPTKEEGTEVNRTSETSGEKNAAEPEI
jgi:hypothetical protein